MGRAERQLGQQRGADVTRPVCANCGQPYGQRRTHEVRLRWQEGEPEPAYEGSLRVVKRGSVRKRPDESLARDIDVWDGRTWFGGYDPFCTLRCALEYARVAWARGDPDKKQA
jgi:hypothetical protein